MNCRGDVGPFKNIPIGPYRNVINLQEHIHKYCAFKFPLHAFFAPLTWVIFILNSSYVMRKLRANSIIIILCLNVHYALSISVYVHRQECEREMKRYITVICLLVSVRLRLWGIIFLRFVHGSFQSSRSYFCICVFVFVVVVLAFLPHRLCPLVPWQRRTICLCPRRLKTCRFYVDYVQFNVSFAPDDNFRSR